MSFGKQSLFDMDNFLVPFFIFWFLVIDVANGRPSSILPSLMSNPETLTHDEGDMAVLFCSVLNLGDHTVTWRKLPQSAPLTIGTKSWTRDPRVHAEHVPNSSQWNLVIEHVKEEDAGQYECQVSKRKSRLRHKVKLVVKAKPLALLPRIEISGENVLKTGKTLKLTCNASLVDIAVERIAWIKDGEPLLLDKDHRYSVHTSVTLSGLNSGTISSRLEVKDAVVEDSGVYLCRSTERAQMAGVKVEIQGGFTFKRADMKNFEDSSQLQMTRNSRNNRGTSSLRHQYQHTNLILALLVFLRICYLLGVNQIT